MKKFLMFFVALATILVSTSCGTTQRVPITGRKHSLLVSDAQVLSLSKQQYTETLQKSKLSTNSANTQMVKRIGQRLATAVENYFRSNDLTNELQYYEWEFNLIQNKSVNACCLPGGKILVYEGMLPVTQDEASLAIVLGHEVAHAVAKHSAEQLSKQLRQQYGTQVLSSILSASGKQDLASIAVYAAQTGFSFANLKYSRDNETEADYMGLIFAAMAGYDPRVAIPFWERMASSSSSSSQSDLLSDHPSDAKRVAELQRRMPEALQYYNAGTTTATSASTSKKSASQSTGFKVNLKK